jgi:hypothetical protein
VHLTTLGYEFTICELRIKVVNLGMIQHNGMRPHDIAVLLQIIIADKDWMNKDLSSSLLISPAEISNSLQRSVISGLLDSSKRRVMRNALLNFIQHGLPYAFPAIKGGVTRGIPTGYSAPIMSEYLMTSEQIVWAFSKGTTRGEAVAPLYPNAVEASLNNPRLYDLLALLDVMRLGKVREREIAVKLLKQIFDDENS